MTYNTKFIIVSITITIITAKQLFSALRNRDPEKERLLELGRQGALAMGIFNFFF